MLTPIATRGRLLLIVVASALPAILLSLYVALDQRALAVQHAGEELVRRLDLIEALLPAFHLDALPEQGAEALGRAQMVTLIDRHGFVVAQRPALFAQPGDPFPNAAVLEGVARGETLFDLRDPAGMPRLYAARNTLLGGSGMTIVISMPKAVAQEHIDRGLAYTLGGTVAATVALLLIAWVGADRLLLKPIRIMLQTTDRVRAGDLSARTGMLATREELSQLAASLDAMAEQLAERDRALRAALDEQTRLALTDSLTGLYNRRFLHDELSVTSLSPPARPSRSR